MEKIGAVINIHDHRLWETLLNEIPTTDPEIPYGTPEMTLEIKNIYSKGLSDKRILAMGGHEDGIMTFGSSLDDAMAILNDYLNFNL